MLLKERKKWQEDEEEDVGAAGWPEGNERMVKVKDEEPGCTVRRTGFGRGCGSVVRHTTEWMNMCGSLLRVHCGNPGCKTYRSWIVMINSNIIMRIDSLLTRFAVLSRMVSRVWYCLPVDNGALVVVVVVRNSVCTSKRYICWYQWPRGLKRGSAAARFLALRVRILLGAWLLSLVCAVCCQVEVSALGWSLDQRGPTDCGVSECDREASIMRRPWPTGGAGGGLSRQKQTLRWT